MLPEIATNKIKETSIDGVVNSIITLNNDLRQFWAGADGWAPIEVAQLLSKSRLDWQLSLSICLKIWLAEPLSGDVSGRLILAWVNLGSLVEGTMMLFLSVYHEDYKKDIDVIIRKVGKSKEPDELTLEYLRQFFNEKVWLNEDKDWDAWIHHIQQRRNAIHAYKHRNIGTFDEFFADVRRYFEFLLDINSGLPYPL